MRQLQPVVWSKGVFLSPQHLQAQDRFFEDSLRFNLEALSFRHWGYASLQIEAASVSQGQLDIAQAAGLFPDGLAFDTSVDEAPRSRSLDECFSQENSACTFFLAIPQRRPGGVHVAQQRGSVSTRFYAELQMMRDENGGGLEKPVSLARKNLQIVAETESLEGLVVMPLARVIRTESGGYTLDHDYVGPMLNVRASERLMGMLRGLVETLVARSGQLAGARRQRNESLAEFSASDVARFWMLYTINTHLPVLYGLLEAPHVPPESLYKQMLSLAGSLTTFSRTIGPLDFARFEHDRQGSSFLALESQIMTLLDTVIPSRFIALPLRKLRDSVYVADIERDEYIADARVYLAISAEVPNVELIARTPMLVKACSATHLETLIRQALPGVPLTHVSQPPSDIPVKLHYQYFSLDRAGLAWETILRARNFGVYVPDELRNPQMELILFPAAAEA
jgi:type VI secretion system protein ImpJ